MVTRNLFLMFLYFLCIGPFFFSVEVVLDNSLLVLYISRIKTQRNVNLLSFKSAKEALELLV